MLELTPATKPTFWFIGVTTGNSSINRIFPKWAEALELGDCELRGLDFKVHDEPATYRDAVAFIKSDPLSRGALVTTHKIDLFNASRDLFDDIDPLSELMGEVSSISKSPDGSRLLGETVDPMTSSVALEAFLPADHWANTRAEAFVLGAGGSSIAVTWAMMRKEKGGNRPSKVIVANRSEPRLREIERIHHELDTGVAAEYHLTPTPGLSDAICSALKPGSLVINATGLGKDAPGSPLTDAARFPMDGFAWEFNYRGDLVFLDQARAQETERRLTVEDGWVYFIHGWTQVISRVFHVAVPSSGPEFEELSAIAAGAR